jgi:hypothetical protein
MWRPPPDDVVDGIRQEVRRARRRWNAYVAQRAGYGLVAATAAGAVLVLVVALVASAVAFVAALAGVAIGLVALAARLGTAARRAWVGRGRASVWVDRCAGMDGRLATLLELDAGAPARFRPLLTETTLARRRAFSPDEVVPTPVPVVLLAVALGALASLPVAMRLAPLLEPPPLATVAAEGSGAAPPIDGLGSLFRRVLAATASPASPDADRSGAPERATNGGSGGSGEARPTFRGLPAALQASIRRRLWGERWARAADTTPGTARTRTGAADERARTHASPTRDATDPDAVRRAAAASEPGTDVPAAGTASGAGTGSDPDLFGPVTTPDLLDDGRFALGLAARVRTVQTGPRPPSGEAPDPEPDARPTLAVRQRPDAPAHRAVVPPAFTAIVRDTFTHRTSQGARP